jgi:hypothetical protein
MPYPLPPQLRCLRLVCQLSGEVVSYSVQLGLEKLRGIRIIKSETGSLPKKVARFLTPSRQPSF